MRLKQQRVVVVGGTSGIGLAVAHAAIDAGASVVVASGREQSVARAQGELSAKSPESSAHVVDVSNDAAVEAFFKKVGAFDHLVYSAGESLKLGALADMSVEDVRSRFQVRFFGALAAAKYATPFIRPGGSIVFTSGTASTRPFAGWAWAASCCSAVEGLTRALAVEIAPVRVNAVALGVVKTPVWGNFTNEDRESLFEGQAKTLPVAHVGEASEVATAYLYLMENTYATGTVVVADGGAVLV